VPLRQRGGQHALNCGEGGGIAITMRTMITITHKQTLLSSPMVAAAVTTAIARCPSPKKRRIAGPSRESCRESLDDSAEGEDRWRHHDDDGRTRRQQRQCQSAGCEGNGLLMTSAMGSGESGWGWTTKATDERGRP
jgi:hypothetical protein